MHQCEGRDVKSKSLALVTSALRESHFSPLCFEYFILEYPDWAPNPSGFDGMKESSRPC